MRKILFFVLLLFVITGCKGIWPNEPHEPDEIIYSDGKNISCSISLSVETATNGQTIEMYSEIVYTRKGVPQPVTACYYCDDELIATSSDAETKYHVSWKVENLEVGKHTVTLKVQDEDDSIVVFSSTSFYVVTK